MIEKTLSSKLENIFGLKATFNIPSDSREQECCFIQVDRSKSTIRDGLEIAQVSGKIRVFAQSEKMPFGFVAKKIALAETEDTKDIFFFDLEENAGVFNNIAERSLSFVYFYKKQYDPEKGEMNSINITEVTE